MASTIKNAAATWLSRLFPREQDFDVDVDASPGGDVVYVDFNLARSGDSYSINDVKHYRFTNLKDIPARIKLGSTYVRISEKNRRTLRQLADWDPVYQPGRGFIFHEKDVPELLNYLRTKATVRFSPEARQVKVDNRPLEYVHEIKQTTECVEVSTALTDLDSTILIESPNNAKFIENSKFVHVGPNFFRKPPEKQYKTFVPALGATKLRGDQIPLFLLYDLKRLEAEARTQVAPEVKRQTVATAPFETNISVNVDGPWIWLDVKYHADRFKIPYQQIESIKPSQQFIAEDNTWIQVDHKTHSRVAGRINGIREIQRVRGQFRTPTWNFQEVQSLLQEVATIDSTEAYARFLKSLEDFSQIEDRPLPDGLRRSPYSYQKHGYDWLCFLRKYGLNGILADEMGLGKTTQTLIALIDTHSLAGSKTSLIICPPSVLSAWEDELEKLISPVDFRHARYVGTNRTQVLSNLGRYNAILTTYAIATRDINILANVAWEYVVLDEAHKIKNHQTAAAKACKKLVAKHKLAVTGTPIENRLSRHFSRGAS